MPFKKQICACPLDCFDVCSLEVSLDENGKVAKIEGNKAHPVTEGFICEKGRKHLERIYNPKRLKYPMKKENGAWKQITWEEAYGILTEKLEKYIGEYGSKSIALYSYSGSNGLLKGIEDLFFDHIGETTRFKGSICLGAGIAAQSMDFGYPRHHSPEDMYNSKTIVVWGRNPAETSIHQFAVLKKAKEKGTQIIVIDPIGTETAKISHKHIPVLPGGDCALACAAAKYVIEKGLADQDFIENCTEGFEGVSDYLSRLSYEQLSEKCGVSVQDIIDFAETLSVNKPASILIGYGMQRYLYGGTAVRSIDMLAAITGNVGIAGGGANYANAIHENNMDWESVAAVERQHRVIIRAQMGKGLKEANAPQVKMIFISRSNPILQNPNSNDVLLGLQRIDFKICLDHFMTYTAELCDLVLPVTYFLEEEDIVMSDCWNGYIHYNKPCTAKYYEAKSEMEIYTELATRLKMGSFPKMNVQQWIDMLLRRLVEKGLDMEALKRDGFTRNPTDEDIPWKGGRFATESGKMMLIGKEALAAYFSDANKAGGKYRLLTIHNKKKLHSQHYLDVDTPQPIVYISPADAVEEALKNNVIVKLYNKYGQIEAKVSISDNCQKGVLYMYEGWWRKNGGSVNRLTDDRISDIGLQAVFNECTCSIERL